MIYQSHKHIWLKTTNTLAYPILSNHSQTRTQHSLIPHNLTPISTSQPLLSNTSRTSPKVTNPNITIINSNPTIINNITVDLIPTLLIILMVKVSTLSAGKLSSSKTLVKSNVYAWLSLSKILFIWLLHLSAWDLSGIICLYSWLSNLLSLAYLCARLKMGKLLLII